MSYRTIKYVLVFMISILFLVPGLRAEGDKKASRNTGLDKTNTYVAITSLNINNISTFFYNNGISDISSLGNSGLTYPKGSGKTAAFTSGLLWGAKVAGEVDPKVGGTAYRTALVPGKVLPDGTADDPNLDKYRVYRVRSDVYPGGPDVELSTEAGLDGLSQAEERTQYETDWTEWPADMGAPFNDVDENGTYDPTIDIPGVPKADQTIWYVANDLNSTQTIYLANCNPLGIECQVTVWAYNQGGALGSMYFRSYKLINVTNRSALTPTTFEDMYVSMFSDVDLGDAGDDYVGVDTTLSLQYCYNAAATDAVYSPLPPPATGFDFFQGPLVNGVAGEDVNKNGVDDAEDFGIFDGKQVGPGKINLPMTAAYYFANGDPNIGDPPQGQEETADGFRQWYNFFQGKFGISGTPFTDLSSGKITTFALSGDPQAGTGWLDGVQLPAGDRRQGSASGPFTMAPGDTQQVVVAEIVAGAIPGVDRLSAVGLLKFYDAQAQVVYDNFFNVPTAPPFIPNQQVTVTPLDKEIVLDWSKNKSLVQATESSDENGYKFQGYNVYQLPTASSQISEGIRVATYDIVDQVGKISDFQFDVKTGSVIKIPVQFGNDVGIKRFISIKNDAIRGGVPLVNGIKYYFAVTSYNYNAALDAVPNNVENPLYTFTCIPQTQDPGVTWGDESQSEVAVTHEGTADGGPTVNIVDPAATTGHDYEVYFTQRQEVLNFAGDWEPASVDKLKKTLDLTGCSVSIGAAWTTVATEVELKFSLDLGPSPTGAWADGVSITLPAGVTILSAPGFEAGGASIVPEIVGNTINMGDVSQVNTEYGIFHGGETWSVIVGTFTPPIDIDYTVYDDTYGNSGVPVNASSTVTISAIGETRLAKYWNLRDATSGVVKLENQGILAGSYVFPPREDLSDAELNPTTNADPILDGFQIGVDINYAAPIDWTDISINEGSQSTFVEGHAASSTAIEISPYTYFSGTVSSKATDNFGFGTDDINSLQQDYELRFTGVWDTTVVNGQTIISIKPGTGSMATIFSGVSSTSRADHPLNPNPGSNTNFLVPIPFEVWNKDTGEQVNLSFRDRLQTPTADPFFSWNPKNRMYAVIDNSPYDATTPKVDPPTATWVAVFWGTNYHVGDVVTIIYANPIQIGLDKYLFNTKGQSFSTDLAKSQVDQINVFPNPYYGVNTEELNKYNRFVTFSHLPAKATVRIFNLAGVLVKTIQKDDPGQFLRWDLQNNSGLPVASGLYIAYMELPDLGTTKIVKVAIIQEEQILDRF
jgi:hypothetical protein